jgi:hypothetical protein
MSKLDCWGMNVRPPVCVCGSLPACPHTPCEHLHAPAAGFHPIPVCHTGSHLLSASTALHAGSAGRGLLGQCRPERPCQGLMDCLLWQQQRAADMTVYMSAVCVMAKHVCMLLGAWCWQHMRDSCSNSGTVRRTCVILQPQRLLRSFFEHFSRGFMAPASPHAAQNGSWHVLLCKQLTAASLTMPHLAGAAASAAA